MADQEVQVEMVNVDLETGKKEIKTSEAGMQTERAINDDNVNLQETIKQNKLDEKLQKELDDEKFR